MLTRTPSPREVGIANRALGYQPALDGIRAVAVVSVIGLHAGWPLLRGGGIGVFMFFVLSGCLITTLLIDEVARKGTISLGRFYLRRALRLLPALLAMIGVVTAYSWWFETDHSRAVANISSLPAVLFYAANWSVVSKGFAGLGAYAPTWSLSVEEQFYLAWPIALIGLFWLFRRRLELIVMVLLVGSVCSLTVRLLAWHGINSTDRMIGTDAVADQLLIGSACALIVRGAIPNPRFNLRLAARIALWPAVAGLVATIIFLPNERGPVVYRHAYWTIGFTLVAAAVAVVVAHVLLEPESLLSRLLSLGWLRYLGRISYGLYIWHYIIIIAVGEHLHARALVQWPTEALALLTVATASYYLVERPFLRLKRRFQPVSSPRQHIRTGSVVADG